MAETTGAQIDVVLTGFGPFHGVPTNPTTVLLERVLAEGVTIEGVRVVKALVLTTAGRASAKQLAEVRGELAADGERERPLVFLHFGVDGKAGEFHLELQAFNEAAFRVADEEGWQPESEEIVEGAASCLQTKLPLDRLLSAVREAGHAAAQSEDAGRFVCNWIYFQSLVASSRFASQHSLFCHVPPFSTCDAEEQWKLLHSLLTALRDCCTASEDASVAEDGVVASVVGSLVEVSPMSAAVVELGFSPELAAKALEATGHVSADAAVAWIVERMEDAEVSAAAPIKFREEYVPLPMKMMLLVRKDLGMSAGKIAAQCSHATLGIYRSVMERDVGMLSVWQDCGEPTIVLAVSDLSQLEEKEAQAISLGLCTHVVRDAGRTEVDPHTRTVLAIGPAPSEIMDAVTGDLPTLR